MVLVGYSGLFGYAFVPRGGLMDMLSDDKVVLLCAGNHSPLSFIFLSGWSSFHFCLNEKHVPTSWSCPVLSFIFSLLFIISCSSAHHPFVAQHKAGAPKLCICLLLEKKLQKLELKKGFRSLAAVTRLGWRGKLEDMGRLGSSKILWMKDLRKWNFGLLTGRK